MQIPFIYSGIDWIINSRQPDKSKANIISSLFFVFCFDICISFVTCPPCVISTLFGNIFRGSYACRVSISHSFVIRCVLCTSACFAFPLSLPYYGNYIYRYFLYKSICLLPMNINIYLSDLKQIRDRVGVRVSVFVVLCHKHVELLWWAHVYTIYTEYATHSCITPVATSVSF